MTPRKRRGHIVIRLSKNERRCDRCLRIRHKLDVLISAHTGNVYCWKDMPGCDRAFRELAAQYANSDQGVMC